MKNYKLLTITAFSALTLFSSVRANDTSVGDQLFTWAEANLTQLFIPEGQTTGNYQQYYYRYYPETNIFLAISGQSVYYYMPDKNTEIRYAGLISDYIEDMAHSIPFVVSDTGQMKCYNSSGTYISCLNTGQDGSYTTNLPDYTNHNNGTTTDNNSGLMWQNTSDANNDGSINYSDKMSQANAVSYCSNLELAGYTDWRLPNIKAMYSLIDFSGEDVSGYDDSDTSGLTPFIDTTAFDFAYGDTSAEERIIDVQYATTTLYVSTTMNGDATMFGVNMADGRIKGYPIANKRFNVQCIRGNESYGNNDFIDNDNETITDMASSLMWQKNDSLSPMDWDSAISYCENSTTAGYTDWLLPDAKQLQSLVDYTRSPDTSQSAAIDPLFNATSFTSEAGQTDWGYYWSSTTHKGLYDNGGNAVYVAFGRALGYMNNRWLDVHGAGAQRSDPKINSGNFNNSYVTVTDENGNYTITHGPQGDVVRINNYVRCVR